MPFGVFEMPLSIFYFLEVFLSFLKVMDRLPDIETILKGEDFTYSEEVDVLYALSSGIVSHYLQNPSSERLENLLRYTLELKGEFAVMIAQDLQRAGITMEGSEVFKEWVRKFSYLLE